MIHQIFHEMNETINIHAFIVYSFYMKIIRTLYIFSKFILFSLINIHLLIYTYILE